MKECSCDWRAGHLVLSCNGPLFQELIEFLLAELKANTSTSTTRTYIQCVGAIRSASFSLTLSSSFFYYLTNTSTSTTHTYIQRVGTIGIFIIFVVASFFFFFFLLLSFHLYPHHMHLHLMCGDYWVVFSFSLVHLILLLFVDCFNMIVFAVSVTVLCE